MYGVVVTGPDAERFVQEFWGSWEAECLPRNEEKWTPTLILRAMLRFKRRRAEAGRPFRVWVELAE